MYKDPGLSVNTARPKSTCADMDGIDKKRFTKKGGSFELPGDNILVTLMGFITNHGGKNKRGIMKNSRHSPVVFFSLFFLPFNFFN